MKSIYLMTLRSLFRDIKTYVYLAVMFLAEGFFITYVNLQTGYSALEYSMEFLELSLIIALPLITAELFAADRQSGFEKTLLSFGLSGTNILLGKALAVLTVFIIPVSVLFFIPPVFEIFGIVNLLSAYAAIIAFILLSITLISVCVFVSLTAKTRLAAYISSYTALLLVYLFGIFSGIVPNSKSISLLLLTAVLVVISILIYVFTKSALLFGEFFCITEAVLILLYFVAPRFIASAFRGLLDLLSPCASLNSIIYGPFDLTSVAHLILYTSVFTVFSFMQLKRRKYE